MHDNRLGLEVKKIHLDETVYVYGDDVIVTGLNIFTSSDLEFLQD